MAFEDTDTGFQLYLRQIGEYPLITVEEEVVLAGRIKKGDQEARHKMVRSNPVSYTHLTLPTIYSV